MSLGQSRRWEDVTLRQDARNVGTQVRTHRTQGTQKIRRLRQDAMPTDQTQDPFLLMYLTNPEPFCWFLVGCHQWLMR